MWSKMDKRKLNTRLLYNLERLFKNEKTPYPVKIKNTIYVGFYGVNKQADGLYKVFSIKDKSVLHVTFSKAAAIALAKLYATKFSEAHCDKIIKLDDEYSKHYLDRMFYENTYTKSESSDRKLVALTRLDYTSSKIRNLEHELNIMVLRNY